MYVLYPTCLFVFCVRFCCTLRENKPYVITLANYTLCLKKRGVEILQ